MNTLYHYEAYDLKNIAAIVDFWIAERMMAYNILSLPPELILRILEWSDYLSIIYCAKVCRISAI